MFDWIKQLTRGQWAGGACLLTGIVAAVAAPAGGAGAASTGEPEVTIHPAGASILAGEGVVVYGQVSDLPSYVQPGTVVLYEHLAGSSSGYTEVGETTANAQGLYQLAEAEANVTSNRSWFVQVAGGNAESRTVNVQVAALVSLKASSHSVETGAPVTFTGHVSPSKPGARVLLQAQIGGSDDWRTLASEVLDGESDYSIAHRWSEAGAKDVRVLFEGDVHNVDSASDPVTVIVQPQQQPDISISSSSALIAQGQTVIISGELASGGTTGPEAGTEVTLLARTARNSWSSAADTTTDARGRYRFDEVPTQTTDYQVRSVFPTFRSSAVMVQGVKGTVSLTASMTEAAVGRTVRFTGEIRPATQGRALTGHAIYLQRLGDDGHWQTVAVRRLFSNGRFGFGVELTDAGKLDFRARITGDEENAGAASAPITVTATLPHVSVR